MPKYGIHKIVLDEVKEKLRRGPGNAARLADILENNQFQASLGAIGPDLFFFAKDYAIVNTLFPVYQWLYEVHKIVEEIKEPIEKIEKKVEAFRDQTLNIMGLNAVREVLLRLDAIETNAEKLKQSAITAGLLFGVNPLETTTHRNILAQSPLARSARELYENVLKPPLQNNYEEQDWYWFDMLHYRNTGDFAHNLIQLAGNNPRLQAYAIGYLTHYATDVVGHPYVNQIVGAPFRLSVQRHVTVENYMDAYQYSKTGRGVISQTLYTDLEFEANPTLPDEIADLLKEAMRRTYRDKLHPLRLGQMGSDPCNLPGDFGFLSSEQIKDAYRLLRTALSALGGKKDLRPQEPFAGVSEVLADLMSTMNRLNPPPAPPDLFPGIDPTTLFSNSFSMEGLIVALTSAGQSLESWFEEWVAFLAEAAQYCLATAIALVRILRDLVALNGYVTGAVVLAILYGVEVALYQLTQLCDKIMTLNGFAYPDPEDIKDDLSLSLMWIFDPKEHFTNPKEQRYPHLRKQGQCHLRPPAYEDECRNTLPAFHRGALDQPVTPAAFIRGDKFEPAALQAYAQAATPATTQELRQKGHTIGNAVDFSTFLIENSFNRNPTVPREIVFANWNLDGDRGYGAKSWTALLPHNGNSTALGKLCFTRLHPDGTVDLQPDQADAAALEGTADEESNPCRSSDDFLLYEFKAKDEAYDNLRQVSELNVANLRLSEANIDDRFKTIKTRNPAHWQCILSDRLKGIGNTWRENVYHVNGILTPAYDAFYEAFHIEHYFRTDKLDAIRVRLLYNTSEDVVPLMRLVLKEILQFEVSKNILTEEADLPGLADFLQGWEDKFWSFQCVAQVLHLTNFSTLASGVASIATTAPSNIPPIENATTIAVIALLYNAMAQTKPVGFVGYSQGTQQIFNGILGFALQGPAERDFLKQQVKVLYIAHMVEPESRQVLARLVNHFASIQNPSDLVPNLVGNFPPAGPVDLSGVNPADVIRFIRMLAEEKHQAYLNFPRIRTGNPNHQNFF